MRPAGSAIALTSATIVIASCSTTFARPARTPEAQRQLDQALAGRTAGQPVQCLPDYRAASNMQVIDDWTILFRDGRTVYLQTPRGGCPGISSYGNTLVTHLQGDSRLCNGDINRVVDLQTKMGGAGCVFGPFVPYRKAS
jgi:hypothetical protein